MNFKDLSRIDKLSMGFVLIVLGLIFTLGNPQGLPDLVGYTFASEPVQVSGFEVDTSITGDSAKRIIVPDLGIDLEVGDSDVIGGYWEVFTDKAGWGAGSALPGEEGNQVIFAHAREGLFLPLRDIKAGMSIYVLTQDGWFTYIATEISEVLPNQTEVIEPSEDERLTLYTCSGFNDSKRLIVVAKPV